MNNSIHILIKCDEVVMEGLKPFFVAVEKEDWKFDMLCDLYNTLTITQAIIFCNTRSKIHYQVNLPVRISEKNECDAIMANFVPRHHKLSLGYYLCFCPIELEQLGGC